MTPAPWLAEFRAALVDEFAGRPIVAALATVDEHGMSRARSVICRRAAEDGDVWLCSDARSAKNSHLRRCPAAELAFWLPNRREQYRIAGTVAVLSTSDADPRRAALWAELSDAARALFAGPAPGRTLEAGPDAFPAGISADAPPPGSFELLVLSPVVVEHLDLNPHPHRRRRWRAAGRWGPEEHLNP